ncbi:MAG: ABC transporter permease [Terriglobales bacterium]
MGTREAILIALETLRAHKLRSFLTLLGVIISVCTLVAVVALVQGVNGYVGTKVAGLGSNVFSVNQFSLDEMTNPVRFNRAKQRNPILRYADYRFLRAAADLPRAVAAQAERSGTVKHGGRSLDEVGIIGATPNLLGMSPFQVARGRFLAPTDQQHRTYVAFVGPDVVSHLFKSDNPLGRHIYISGQQYEVVGVATKQGDVFGQSQDNFVMVPLGTYQKVYGDGDSLTFQVQARSARLLPATMDEMEMLMRVRRHLRWNEKDNFGVIGSQALMNLWHTLTGAIAAVMVSVSVVFLVVGGIVIMNIMLAAVTERTQEVGTRKAVGARRVDILRQFLIESAVLSTTGGLIGVLLAYLFTLAAGALTPIPFSLPVVAVVVAVAISTLVGLFFGVYPANKAARLTPIAALHAEG